MTNSNIWECLTPAQYKELRGMVDKDYQRIMATIHLYVLEGMPLREAINEVIGEVD